MNNAFGWLRSAIGKLKHDGGQDLVEYALVVALIAFAAVSGIKTLATKLNASYNNIGTVLTTNIN